MAITRPSWSHHHRERGISQVLKCQKRLPWGSCVILVILLTATVGCSNRASVSGTVTLDGQPIDGGAISFIPDDNAKDSASWGKIKEGYYLIRAGDGPVPGPHRVEIRWSRKTGRKTYALPPASPTEVIEEVREVVPARYNSQSKLKAEIETGENTVNFELESQ